MFWIVQNNLYNEAGYLQLIQVLERFNLPNLIVKVVPIVNRLVSVDFDTNQYLGNIEDIPEPEIDNSQKIMVCGSYTLSKIAKSRGWVPGSFINDNFNFEKWRNHYGNYLLNCDSIVSRFDEVKTDLDEFFIRPCEDSKSFSGMITTSKNFFEWQTNVLKLEDELSTLKPETMVSYCPPKIIYREYRFFVVDGEIITGSQYKIGNRVNHSENIDSDAFIFVGQMISEWCPDRAFVIDIALTPDGYKVIELNNINSAGFYASNVSKFVQAIENMKF